MRKNLNRGLAILLSVALLISCSISGLVLPALADANVDLLEGKLAASYTVQPGASLYPEALNVALENGQRYAMRFESKGSKGFVSFTDGNNAWRQQNVTDTGDNWRSYQVVFTANGASDNFAGHIMNEGSTNPLEVRNIQLFKAPADGSFDIMNGGDMDTQTEFFGGLFAGETGAQITADPDDPSNSVMYFTKDGSYSRLTNLGDITAFNPANVYKFTFRMKGYLRINGRNVTNPTYLPNPDATTIAADGRLTYYHAADWTTFSYYIKIGADPNGLEFCNATQYGNYANLWMDDLQIFELPEPTALTMNKSAVGVYPGNGTQLSVTMTPGAAYVKDGAIAWTSSNPEAVTVDSQGNVKVATTAAFGTQVTITAAYSETVKATCVVTVDENAPKPPAYSVVGTNGFAGVDTARTVNNGSDPAEILANVLLKANTRYVVRYTAKNSTAGATVSHNGGADVDSIPVSAEWRTSQFMFTTDNNAAGTVFKVTVSPAATAGATLQIKDFEIWEAPKDGTFNLMPAGTFDAQSQLFTNYYADGVVNTVDPDDATNNVLCYPGDKLAHNQYWSINDIISTNQVVGKMFRVSFRMKGSLRLENWTAGDILAWSGVPAKVVYTKSNVVRYLYYASQDWMDVSFDLDVESFSEANSFVFAHATTTSTTSVPLYIDDMTVCEVVPATGLVISKETLAIYPTDVQQLTVSPSPENSYLDSTLVTWQSTDPTVASVDAYGNVTAVSDVDGATATIQALLNGQVAASCVVTIDYDAPTPPVETQPGVNAMADEEPVTVMSGGTAEVVPGAILKEGTRYALRFVTKSSSEGFTLSTNAGTTPFAIPATDALRANQILFTPTARVESLKITVAAPAADGAQIEVTGWELYEAPKDGSFNLIPAGDSSAQSAFLTNHFNGTETNAVELVADPDDPDNTVIKFPKSGSREYLSISTIGGYQSGKVWKLTFRMKGNFRFENWGSGAVYAYQPDAYYVPGKGQYVYFASEDWKTVSYYIKPLDTVQATYIQLCNKTNNDTNVESYIDDIQLYEVEGSDVFAIQEQNLRLYPTSTKQLTYVWGPTNSVLLGGNVTWTSSDPDVVLVDEKTGRITLVGEVGESATITASNAFFKDATAATTVVTIDDTVEHAAPVTSVSINAPLGQDMDIGQQSRLMLIGEPIDNLVGRTTWTTSDDRIVSVDAKGNITALGAGTATVTGTTEFGASASITITVYATANLLVNGDFEQGAAVSWSNSSRVQDGKGQYGSAGYVINGESSTYYNQDIMLKPNTKYEISYRYKAEKGANFRLYTGWPGAAENVKPSTFVEPGTIDDADWMHVSKVFTTADFFAIEVGFAFSLTTQDCNNAGNSVYAYIDNIAIREYIVGGAVETLAIDQQGITLAPGRTTKLTFKATPDPADTNMITWTSSDEQVAYVVSGNVYGVGAGTATITATAKSGATATTTVTVNGAAALLQNGTFETADDPATEENEFAWTLNEKVKYAEGLGVMRSHGIQLLEGGTITQTFKGLKPDTAYQVMFRHIQRDTNGKFGMTIKKADGTVVAEGVGGGASSRRVIFKKDLYKFDFITPNTITADEELTLEFTCILGAEYMRLDQIMIVEAASEVDLIVSDITWTPDNADQMTPDTKVSFIVSVVNQGKEAYTGSKPFTIDIMVDSKKVKTLQYTGKIAVGEMLIIQSPEGEEWLATPGDHMITAHVNSTMSILESDDTNNYLTANLRVAEEKDFVTPPAAALAMGHNRLIFSDHFTTQDTIDKTGSGNHGYKWYITRPWGESNLTPNDYRVEDGVLYLTTEQTAWNYSMCTIDANKTGVGFSYNTGYMEIRVRMKATADNDGYAWCETSTCRDMHLAYDLIKAAGGNPDNWTTAQIEEYFSANNIKCPSCGGTKFSFTKVDRIRVPAVWAFSDETIWGTRPVGKDSLELDWFEYWGDKYGNLRFDTTLHHTLYDETGKELGKVTTGQKHEEPIGDYQWHTYAMGWNKGVIKTYFDNELIGVQRYSKDDFPDPMPTGSINIAAGGADPTVGLFSVLDEQNMPIILGGASDFPLEVDWIHVWQSDGSIEPAEEEDEDVVSFVKNYLTDKDGKVYTGVTVENYKKVLSGETVYLGLKADQQTAIDEKLGASYLKWIEQIYGAQGKAENFIAYYACAEDGTPYKAVDDTNYSWIAGAKTEWDALSAFERGLIDLLAQEKNGMTFTKLLADAVAFVPTAEQPAPEDTPATDTPPADDEPATDAPETDTPETDDPETDDPTDGDTESDEDEDASTFIEDFLTDDAVGEVFTQVTIDNYQDILAGEDAYLALTPEQQAAVDEAIGGSYLDWVKEIRTAKTKASNFIPYYACAEDGTPYTVVDAANYAWILTAKTEWEGLTDFERALIDEEVLAQSGMTFTQMLEMAVAFEAENGPQKAAGASLTWLWIVLGVLGGLIVAGGVTVAILLFVKKKKKQTA